MSRLPHETCDVLVVGAGPAGATAAAASAARGLRVVLAEKASFPRPKVCGCCLNARALSVLDRLDLTPRLAAAGGQPLGHLTLHAAGRHAAVRLPHGLAVSRARLDFELATDAARRGADFREGCRVAALDATEDRWRATLEHRGRRGRLDASVVLVAEGLAGRLLDGTPLGTVRTRRDSRIGVGSVVPLEAHHAAPGAITMACGEGGYVGAVVLEDGSLDLAAAIDHEAARRGGGPGGLVQSILKSAEVDLGFDAAKLRWRGTPRLTRKRVRLADHRLFVLGDAAGYVEPFTGEGMAWAMSAGLAASSFAQKSLDNWQPELVDKWHAEMRRLVRSRQRWCKAMSFVLRRPALSGRLVGALAKTPGLSRPVVTSINEPLPSDAGPERIEACP